MLQRVVARTAEVARSNVGDRTEVLPCYPPFGISGQLMHRSEVLLDDLVGAGEEWWRERDPKCLRSLEVDD